VSEAIGREEEATKEAFPFEHSRYNSPTAWNDWKKLRNSSVRAALFTSLPSDQRVKAGKPYHNYQKPTIVSKFLASRSEEFFPVGEGRDLRDAIEDEALSSTMTVEEAADLYGFKPPKRLSTPGPNGEIYEEYNEDEEEALLSALEGHEDNDPASQKRGQGAPEIDEDGFVEDEGLIVPKRTMSRGSYDEDDDAEDDIREFPESHLDHSHWDYEIEDDLTNFVESFSMHEQALIDEFSDPKIQDVDRKVQAVEGLIRLKLEDILNAQGKFLTELNDALTNGTVAQDLLPARGKRDLLDPVQAEKFAQEELVAEKAQKTLDLFSKSPTAFCDTLNKEYAEKQVALSKVFKPVIDEAVSKLAPLAEGTDFKIEELRDLFIMDETSFDTRIEKLKELIDNWHELAAPKEPEGTEDHSSPRPKTPLDPREENAREVPDFADSLGFHKFTFDAPSNPLLRLVAAGMSFDDALESLYTKDDNGDRLLPEDPNVLRLNELKTIKARLASLKLEGSLTPEDLAKQRGCLLLLQKKLSAPIKPNHGVFARRPDYDPDALSGLQASNLPGSAFHKAVLKLRPDSADSSVLDPEQIDPGVTEEEIDEIAAKFEDPDGAEDIVLDAHRDLEFESLLLRANSTSLTPEQVSTLDVRFLNATKQMESRDIVTTYQFIKHLRSTDIETYKRLRSLFGPQFFTFIENVDESLLPVLQPEDPTASATATSVGSQASPSTSSSPSSSSASTSSADPSGLPDTPEIRELLVFNQGGIDSAHSLEALLDPSLLTVPEGATEEEIGEQLKRAIEALKNHPIYGAINEEDPLNESLDYKKIISQIRDAEPTPNERFDTDLGGLTLITSEEMEQLMGTEKALESLEETIKYMAEHPTPKNKMFDEEPEITEEEMAMMRMVLEAQEPDSAPRIHPYTKRLIYNKWKANPEFWSVERLAQFVGIRRDQIQCIIELYSLSEAETLANPPSDDVDPDFGINLEILFCSPLGLTTPLDSETLERFQKGQYDDSIRNPYQSHKYELVDEGWKEAHLFSNKRVAPKEKNVVLAEEFPHPSFIETRYPQDGKQIRPPRPHVPGVFHGKKRRKNGRRPRFFLDTTVNPLKSNDSFVNNLGFVIESDGAIRHLTYKERFRLWSEKTVVETPVRVARTTLPEIHFPMDTKDAAIMAHDSLLRLSKLPDLKDIASIPPLY